jgi:tetratricopeptide (TPR) repeat protein
MPPIRSRNPGIPHALAAIVDRCLAFEPADRYPSAAARAEDLRRFLGRRPLALARNPSRPERLSNWSRRHRFALTLAAVLAGAGAVVLALASSGKLQAWIFAFVSSDPAATLVEVANDHFNNHEYEKADALYREAVAQNPHLAAAWYGHAKVAYNHRGDIAQSIRLCDRAIREAAGSDLAPAKRFEIDQFRSAVGLALAGRYLVEDRSGEAVGELERVLRTAAHARGLVEEGTSSAPQSPKTARHRVVVRHLRAEALDLLSWASLQRGDLQTCLALRRDAYRLLDSCFELIPNDKATMDALSVFLPMTLKIQADDAEVLGGLMRHRVRFPDSPEN